MSSKIRKLNELENVLCNNDETDKGLIQFVSAFKVRAISAEFNSLKSKGYTVSSLILMLILYRLRGIGVFAAQKAKSKFMAVCDDNTFYRIMNNPMVNWRKVLMNFAKQFIAITLEKGEKSSGTNCFVIDDTDIEKTGKTFEFIGRIFNHVTRKHIIGFKMLTLTYWDGKSLIATDFSLHREKGKKGNYGMNKKEQKKQFTKKRDAQCAAKKRITELDQKKNEVAIKMLKRAVKNGIKASYVLVDSWFTNDMFIKSIRGIKNGMMHLLGMCKIDNRKYKYNGKDLNSNQIISRYSRKQTHYSRKYKSQYFSIIADYKGEKVKLFYIKYGRNTNWTLLLSTNLQLTFVQAIELYQIRWTIEVLFKECKQYLALGKCQNTDFDGQIADATIVLVTHTILSLQKRFGAYETMGELFRETQQQLLELTLWERILKVFIKLTQNLAELLNIDAHEILEQLFQNNPNAQQIEKLIRCLDDDNCEEPLKNAA